MYMTKEEFEVLQELQQESGLPLMAYLKQESIPYSSYTYWRRKYVEASDDRDDVIAPISINAPSVSSSREGISMSLPNGIMVHFSPDMEDAAMRFLTQSGGGRDV